MGTNRFKPRTGAFSLIELLCVMGIILVLAALLFPALRNARIKARQIGCVDHLHETGVGFQSFAHDHDGRFPMAVPASAGGSLEFVRGAQQIQGDFYFSFRHFQVLSNELVTPKLLVCLADTRLAASDFAVLKNQNISYFIGVTAEVSQPDSILAGDRNVTNDFAGGGTVQRLGQNACLRWTHELHGFRGNVLFSDGRVEAKSGLLLVSAKENAPATTAELVLPTVQSAPGLPATPETPLTVTPVGQSSPRLSASGRPNESVAGFQPGEAGHRQEGDPPWMPYRGNASEPPPRPSTEAPGLLPPATPAMGQPESAPVPVAELATVPVPEATNASAVPPPQTGGVNVVATAAPPGGTSSWVYILILLLLALLLVLALRVRSAIKDADEKGLRD